MFYIYHHLGLGDHIICNGLVRHFLEKYKKVSLFCHDHYKENIRYLYRDEKNVNILPYKNEANILKFLSKIDKNNYIKIGFEKLGEYDNQSNMTFDEAFYDIANLDFNIRFDKFFIKRDLEKEKYVLNCLNPKEEKYIYVHDDLNRKFSINPNKHRNDLKIIKNDFRFNLFEMILLLKNAEEIHTMRTGMLDLINSFKLKNTKIYVHEYVRNYGNFVHSKGLNKVTSIL